MPEVEPRDGVSLRKAGDAAPAVQLRKRDGAAPVPPNGDRRTVSDPPLAVRAPRSVRLRVALPLLGLLLAALVGLARFAHVASFLAGAQPTLFGEPADAGGRSATDSEAPASAGASSAGASSAGASVADSIPAAVPLSAMLLTEDLLPGGDLRLDRAAAPREVGLDDYRAAYVQRMTPAACARAKGLMAFQGDGDGAVRRADDVRVTGATGSQQVRRFASVTDARAFLDEQRSWFADCGRSTYRWAGTSAEFDGAIDADGGDELLTSALVDRSSTGLAAEFDGWVRRGDVVFGAYLSGAPATDRATLQACGRALLDRAAAHLAALR